MFFEDRRSGKQRVASIVSLARKDQEAARSRESADLLKIGEDSTRHCGARALHRRPLPLLVATKQPDFERPRVGTSQNRIGPGCVHVGGLAIIHRCTPLDSEANKRRGAVLLRPRSNGRSKTAPPQVSDLFRISAFEFRIFRPGE